MIPPDPSPQPSSLPDSIIHEGDATATYCVDVFAKLAGVSTQTLVHYQELGVVAPCPRSREYNSESLRQLTRLEKLRYMHQLSDSALILVAHLLNEVEDLRHERRQYYR